MSKRKQQRTKIVIIVIVACAVVALGSVLVIRVLHANPAPITLESDFYAKQEVIDINQTEYEQLLAEQKSFVLMVDNPGCITTAKMREMIASFSEDMRFTYYRIMWPEARESSLHNYVKYFPSIVIVDKGKVVAYLQADSSEDAKYYNNATDLQDWLKKHIVFPQS